MAHPLQSPDAFVLWMFFFLTARSCSGFVHDMKHRRGITLANTEDVLGITPSPEDSSNEHTFRIEVWTDPPEAGGELVETISRATDFAVSNAAHRAAIHQRPGKYLVHMNGRHRMSCELAPDPPRPLREGRPRGRSGLFFPSSDTGRLSQAA